MRTKRRALANYIAAYGSFPCGKPVLPDGSNVQFKRDYDRYGNQVWSIRCLHCNRKHAREGMARLRRPGVLMTSNKPYCMCDRRECPICEGHNCPRRPANTPTGKCEKCWQWAKRYDEKRQQREARS